MRAGRLTSRARVRRPVETRDRLRNTVVVWPSFGTAWMAVRPPRRMLSSFGAGEVPAGTMEVEMRAQAELQARDVLEIYAGPEAGTKWRVISPPYRPGDGSMLALVEVYIGELPEPEP
jgi:head-tail adaptor